MKNETITPHQVVSEMGIDLTIEELEEKIAPGTQLNHNETFRELLEIEFDHLEQKIAPGSNLNHNETLVRDDIGLEFEELEEKIAPGQNLNHNETRIWVAFRLPTKLRD